MPRQGSLTFSDRSIKPLSVLSNKSNKLLFFFLLRVFPARGPILLCCRVCPMLSSCDSPFHSSCDTFYLPLGKSFVFWISCLCLSRFSVKFQWHTSSIKYGSSKSNIGRTFWIPCPSDGYILPLFLIHCSARYGILRRKSFSPRIWRHQWLDCLLASSC